MIYGWCMSVGVQAGRRRGRCASERAALRRADAAGVVPAADVERHVHSGGGGHLLAWSDAAVLLTVCTPAGQPLAPHTHTH